MTDFDKLLKRDLYVLVCEYDSDAFPRPMAFEQYIDDASLERIKAFRDRVSDHYGKTRIAKLQFIDEGNS